MNVRHIHVGTAKARRVSGPLEMEFQAAGSNPEWVLRTKLGPLEKQPAFAATQPSLQPKGNVRTWLPLVSLSIRGSSPPWGVKGSQVPGRGGK